MIIIVPFKSEVLNKIEDNVHKFTDEYLAEKATSYRMRLMVPKFKIESTIDLEGPLKQVKIFLKKSVKLTRICNENLNLRWE